MRDYTYTDVETGRKCLVSEMPTADIHECLASGFVVNDNDTNAEMGDIIDRLRIELTARRIEGRL